MLKMASLVFVVWVEDSVRGRMRFCFVLDHDDERKLDCDDNNNVAGQSAKTVTSSAPAVSGAAPAAVDKLSLLQVIGHKLNKKLLIYGIKTPFVDKISR